MKIVYLYSDGGPDSVEAHRLLTLAGVDHLVKTKPLPNWTFPQLFTLDCREVMGLKEIKRYLAYHHQFVEPVDQPVVPSPT